MFLVTIIENEVFRGNWALIELLTLKKFALLLKVVKIIKEQMTAET